MNRYEPKSAGVKRQSIIGRFRKSKKLAVIIGSSMLLQIIYPNYALALTAGPSSPEFSSFEPVATTNMVNDFTGQFIYNLPVLEVPGAAGGGYALSLSYHSGDGPESEASWVGFGWTLNPGSISRNKRGLPDDYKNKSIKYYNSAPKNWTVAATGSFGLQATSVLVTVSATARYNYYKGFGIITGAGLSLFRGLLSLNYSYSDGSGTFSPSINPGAALSYLNKGKKEKNKDSWSLSNYTCKNDKGERSGFNARKAGMSVLGSGKGHTSGVLNSVANDYIHYMLSSVSLPMNETPYTGESWDGYISVTLDPGPVPVGMNMGLNVSYVGQENVKVRDVATYGYMYSGNNIDTNVNDVSNNEAMYDYTLEHASTFTKRDRYLPVPTSTPDAFFVSGEGLSGGFRMYNDRIGLFSPNYVSSHTNLHTFGVDIHLGMDFGAGTDYTDGFHTVTVQSSWPENPGGDGNTDSLWFVPYDFVDTAHEVSENMFFRFNNDMGGQVLYDDGRPNPVPLAIRSREPYVKLPLQIQEDTTVPGQNRRSARASNISYHTNREINTFINTGGTLYRPQAFEKRLPINKLAGREDTVVNSELADEIGEVSVVNEGGNRYTYGLPVYNAAEKNFSRGIQQDHSTVTDRFWVHANVGNLNDGITVGEELTTPYASQFLLTQITTPDYLDINGNGPDDQDFGGYTRFSYNRAYGSDDKTPSGYTNWYRWRTPFNGMASNPNRMSDNTDDMGSYQSGYKEVYYLDTIETKTHFAVFKKHSRTDGKEASANDDDACNNPTATGSHTTDYLEKIELFAKPTIPGGTNTLIKTVHFDYNYECWPGTINSSSGKLTLKKVWFEYNGVVNAYISPYKFEYSYPTGVTYPSQYAYIQTEMSGALIQNPSYSPYIDCWGNYQDDGNARRQLLKSWVSQVPDAAFDPAAWQLKRIILPSGGEIHVQYEQHSYSHVQDREACAMVSLTDGANTVASGGIFTLNLAEIGVSTPTEKTALVDLMNNSFVGDRAKMYFKFFYTLKSGDGVADFGSCNGEYIDGYVLFDTAYVDGSGNVKVQIQGSPQQVCKDFVNMEVGGKLKGGDCRTASFPGDLGVGSVESELTSLATMFMNKVLLHIPTSPTFCLQAKPDRSYLRIPIPKKLGGGIRVKRLMMYNKGIDAGSEMLYGTHYIYENEQDGTSYGVATNEPAENRDENPLVTSIVKRDEQTDWEKTTAGKDKEQFEGPLNWNILPSASIGYSRVIKQSIYQAQATTTGYTVVDYYTVKDYPFDGVYSALGAGVRGVNYNPILRTDDGFRICFGMFSYETKTGIRGAQSYSFLQNDMHGQIRAISDYRGVYKPVEFNDLTAPPVPVAKKTYDYYKPGEQVPMYDFLNWRTYYTIPGRESDITIDRRAVCEHSEETRTTGDWTFGVYGYYLIPFPITIPIHNECYQKMSTISVSKVIHYPCILRSTSVMKDGYVQLSVNQAFDPLTGKPVITSTFDGFHRLNLPEDGQARHNGMYTAYNIPASAFYPAMGQKSWNDRYCFYASCPSTCSLIYSGPTSGLYSVSGVNVNNTFTPGDLIALHSRVSGSTYDNVEIAHVMNVSGSNINVAPTIKYNSALTLSNIYKVEILESGYTNQLASTMDGFTEYGQVNGIEKLIADLNAAIWTVTHTSTTTVTINMRNYVHISIDSAHGYQPSCKNQDYQLYKMVVSYTSGLLQVDAHSPSGIAPCYTTWTTPGSFTVDGGTIGCPEPDKCQHMLFVCDMYKNIIKAQTTTYSDRWAYDTVAYEIDTTPTVLNYYESGLRGKWRPYETWVYRDTTVKGNNPSVGQRNYNYAGTVPFYLFRWDTIFRSQPSKWTRTNHIEAYSPHGNATQEFDAENVYSAAKYGYNGIMPYMVSQNSKEPSIHFESFENIYTTPSAHAEEMMSVASADVIQDAHTGKYGYSRAPSATIVLPPVTDYSGNGMAVRFWAKIQGYTTAPFNVTASGGTMGTLQCLGRSGAWALYEVTWAYGSMSLPATVTFTITNSGAIRYVFDDIRVQPTDAKATCYVYDAKTLKLSAVLDDQLFATFYQYNGEGKLVRTMVETAKGIKTAEESEYHIPMIPRL